MVKNKLWRTAGALLALVIASLLATSVAAQETQEYEFTLSAGIAMHSVSFKHDVGEPEDGDTSDVGYHFGLGLKAQLGASGRHYLGAGLDFSSLLDETVTGYRAIDYQYALSDRLRLGGFFGAASLDSGLPQNGYYTGLNIEYIGLLERLGFALELRHGNGLGRDIILEDDPEPDAEGRPDMFVDYAAVAVMLTYRF